MKKIKKSIPIYICILAMVVVSLMCCCFSSVTEASQSSDVPSCHQVVDNDNQASSQSAQECDCDVSKISLKEKQSVEFKLAITEILPVESSSYYQSFEDDLNWLLKDSPPEKYSSIPIYIQHSVFRI